MNEPVDPKVEVSNRPSHTGSTPRKARKPWWIWLIVAVAVLALVGIALMIWQSKNEPEEPVTPAAVTITNPVPTPAITAMDKEPGSAFYDLLPDTVLQYALVDSEATDTKRVRRSLESVTLTYSDGDDAEITVTATQWETKKEAVKQAKALDAKAAKAYSDAPLNKTPVEVDEEKTGTAWQRLGADEGQTTWTNGTSVLTAVGPAADLGDFYTAFPV